jgi:tRNA G18 (ribose-2'-O)-methylase SpoU
MSNRRNWYRKRYEQEMILSKHQPPGPFPFVLVLDHLKAGYNVGKIIRAANAFGCRELHLIAIPLFDPSPAKGTLRQTRTRSFETFDSSYQALKAEGYQHFALDKKGDCSLGNITLPEKSAFVVGHEEYGLSFSPETYPDIRRLSIPQFGQVQSLNVSIAASIACYEYLREHRFPAQDSPLHP